MIKIKLSKSNDNYKELRVSGHSYFADYGNNIVCAAISVLTIGIINGLTEVCNITDLDIKSKDGLIEVKIPNNLSQEEYNYIKMFFDTLLLSYEQITEEYPNEIKLEVINND